MKNRMMILFLFGAVAFSALPPFAAAVPLVDSSQMNLSAINSIEATRGIPVGTVIAWGSPGNPDDADKWLECNGTSTAGYPELAAIVGAKTPDYTNQFLRGGGVGQVGQVTADSTRSHYHGQPSHTHSVDARLTSTAVSGTAAGQTYQDYHTMWTTNMYDADNVTVGSGPIRSSHLSPTIASRQSSSSSVTASVSNGASTGTAYASGADNTFQNSNSDGTQGGIETAPQHIRVRYLIRALP